MSTAGLRREGAAHMAVPRYAEADRCFRVVFGVEPDNLSILSGIDQKRALRATRGARDTPSAARRLL